MDPLATSHSLGNALMQPHATLSPVSLRYIAALRGNKPKKTGIEFSYAEAFCRNPEGLICLAASNPEGRFFGLVADDAARRAAEEMAALRGTFNVIFLAGSPSETLARIGNGSSLPPMLDYLCCREKEIADSERVALFDLANLRLNAGGLFVTSYMTANSKDGALRFIVREMATEMDEAQKVEFLSEIKKLAALSLAKNLDLAHKLDAAIAAKAPQDFFAHFFEGGAAKSVTFDMLAAMGGRGFAYGGDAHLASNYVELAVPAIAQDLVISCRNNPLYEPIKDLALDRTERCDIWVKTPQEQSSEPAVLFGGFAYGILCPAEEIPPAFAAQGKVIDLSGSLYTKVIALMSIMPIGVGDALSHPSCADEKPEKILEVMQVLVACGFASPMRGSLKESNMSSVTQPRLVGGFNRYLDKTTIGEKDVWLASQVMGCGVTVPASDAFVMQALNRAGLTNSVSALMPELRRIAGTPSSLTVIKGDEPTAEMALDLIRDVVGKSLPQWYALALLEAA